MKGNFFSKYTAIAVLLLFSISSLYSQGANVKFDKTIYDFGKILLNSGAHSYTFHFKNISKQAIVIQTVISSCGCTTPTWTKSPIMPGKNGSIEATFLNNQGPYPFDKSLTVYITGEEIPIVLRIRGEVKESISSTGKESVNGRGRESASSTGKESVSGRDGESVSVQDKKNAAVPEVEKSTFDYGMVAAGKLITATFKMKNLGKRDLIIQKANTNSGKIAVKYPAKIAPGSTELIEVKIDTKAESGENGYIISLFTNSPTIPEVTLIVTANIFYSKL